MKIAVFADLHLPDRPDTVKEQVLDMAVHHLRCVEKVDQILCAGDMTAAGTVAASERLIRKLRSIGTPFLITPGNAEHRTPQEREESARILATPVAEQKFRMLDSADGFFTDEAVRLLNDLPDNAIPVTHTPPDHLPEKDRLLLESVKSKIRLLIAGHLHIDKDDGIVQLVRGMDPDKAIGAPPALTIFELDGHNINRRNITPADAEPRNWSAEAVDGFLSMLGISGMDEPLENLAFAAAEKVPCVELRYWSLTDLPEKQIHDAVKQWRDSGGHTLSVHLPDIGFRDGAVTGEERLRRTLDAALATGCDRFTLHVPAMSVADAKNPEILAMTADRTAECLAPVIRQGMYGGIENMHMRPSEPPGDLRNFGYTPAECRQWIDMIRGRLGAHGDRLGFHFDIGHARNNAPYSSTDPVCSWLAAFGSEVNGMHLHQVAIKPDGTFTNHAPLMSFYDPLISLASLFLSWQSGQLHHAPMFLEIRNKLGPASLRALRHLFAGTH